MTVFSQLFSQRHGYVLHRICLVEYSPRIIESRRFGNVVEVGDVGRICQILSLNAGYYKNVVKRTVNEDGDFHSVSLKRKQLPSPLKHSRKWSSIFEVNMLREIINFTRSLSPESFKRGLKPAEGLHIFVGRDNSGQLMIDHFERFQKEGEPTKFLQECVDKQVYTSCVSNRKRLDAPYKINHSSSPFCVAFVFNDFKTKLLQTDVKLYFNMLSTKAKEFCSSTEMEKLAEQFLGAIDGDFLEKIQTIPEYGALKKNDFIYVYFQAASISDFKIAHKNYLSKRAVNKEKFNLIKDGKTYGVTDYLNSYGDKKLFLQHRTAPFDINHRIVNDDLFQLFYFSELIRNKQLPNPLPIFIDKEELNEKAVKIFHSSERERIGYAEIIRTLYKTHGQDLGNYYLLNIQGKSVKDFDFVSSFQYTLEPPIMIENLFQVKSELATTSVDNIFDFERKIVQRIFDNQLVKKQGDSWWLRYFDDIDNKPKYIRPAMFRLVLKYRKAFYDYIYKSKREAVSAGIFHDIMQTGILDTLKQDEFKDNKHTKDFSIKEKLNIWFSLYEFFDNNHEKKGGQSMANRIRELQQRMKAISASQEEHIDSDDEFAFTAGQVIYYLLSQSETSNKTHALLEPFLQKSDAEQFKLAISRVFDQYKHAITFYKGRFEKLMAEVLSYNTDTNLKSLMPMTLAGYFAENVIYEKTNNTEVRTANKTDVAA